MDKKQCRDTHTTSKAEAQTSSNAGAHTTSNAEAHKNSNTGAHTSIVTHKPLSIASPVVYYLSEIPVH